MIKEVKMFTIICDNCGADAFEDNEFSAWNEEGFAESEASEEGWQAEGHKHYCPACFSFDDNDELVINSERKKEK